LQQINAHSVKSACKPLAKLRTDKDAGDIRIFNDSLRHEIRMPADWSVNSWKNFPATQQPVYADQTALSEVLKQLSHLPPLVTSWEVDHLKHELAIAQEGKAWLLQGGDCAESFDDCQSEPIASKLKVLLQMSLAILFGSRCKIVRVGRMAGQYAKPRSSDVETRDGLTLPCYRGDLINRFEFANEARQANPQFLLRGYERSALTLNFVRALSEGGFADLHHPENWKLLFVSETEGAKRYQRLVASLMDALRLMETISSTASSDFRRVDFFTSHEALHLDYETALTRASVRGVGHYNLGTHLPWIGDRTRKVDGAHVEYARGIRNPIAVKVGASIGIDELLELITKLNPENEPGRLTLIHRMGHSKIAKLLPPIVESVHRLGHRVLWVCDPMHGNTIGTAGGRKTRQFDDIVSELRSAFHIHKSIGSRLGGVHLELTGENVTECTGGSRGLTESDLESDYRSIVDPRLNYEQAMEVAFAIAEELAKDP
jgi:3-deoxy-7-phosphoheptulonate synthase